MIAVTNPITTSFHKGTKVAQGHNNRDPNAISKEKHIDPNGEHETLIHEKLKDAFKRIFDDAMREYNINQKDSRRIIKNYLQKIKNSEQQHPCYEVIVTLGDKDTHPPSDVCKKIYKEVLDNWPKRNPNLIIIGAYYHNDEQGAPHMHIDYIPVAYQNSRGMSVQCSHTKALKEMGFKNNRNKYKETELIQWTDRERAYLDELCKQRGIEVHHPDAGKGKKHLEKDLYIITKKIEELEEQKKGAEKLMKDFLNRADNARQKAAYEINNAQKQRNITDNIKAENDALEKDFEAKKAEIKSELNALAEEFEGLLHKRNQYFDEVNALEEEFNKLETSKKLIKDSLRFKFAFQNLKINMDYDPEFKKFEKLLENEAKFQDHVFGNFAQESVTANEPDNYNKNKNDPLSIDFEY